MIKTIHIPSPLKAQIARIIERERPASLLRIMRGDPLMIQINMFGDYFLTQQSYPSPLRNVWTEYDGLEKLVQLPKCSGFFDVLVSDKKTRRIENIIRIIFPGIYICHQPKRKI